MTVNVLQFKERFEEFKSIDNIKIQQALTDAVGELNSTVLGTSMDLATCYQAADILASGPMGEQAKFKMTDGKTVYWHKLHEIKRRKAIGYRLI